MGDRGDREFGGIHHRISHDPDLGGDRAGAETWQLIINTGTTIVTFLMVFLIQKSQNKDSKAIHLKLNELLASHEGTSNRMVNIEDLTEEELDHLYKFYIQLSKLAQQEHDLTTTHSIDAAEENQKHKSSIRKPKTK
ncbi:low affinity iron permease [Mucilaginibacter yixingensis]|uniref:Low affinity iron permease n=2 Tax=Mucilaginibacter yixingensis TaxID=1295612 RepID=A0A2T5JEB1_9SPHI|nr:low affinity iron permease [Mucilaginibacter yixingensis]